MYDAFCVRRFQARGDLVSIVESRLDRLRSAQRSAFHQFHDNGAVFYAIDRGDVRMV